MKKAYSLVELLLVLLIISVLSVLSIQIFSPRTDQYRQLYTTAYDTLVQSAGNAFLSWNPECVCQIPEEGEVLDATEICWTRECWLRYVDKNIERDATGGIAGFPREYPGFLFGGAQVGTFDGSGTDEAFCRSLTRNLNTVNQENECTSFISGINPEINKGVGNDFQRAFCALVSREQETEDGKTTKVITCDKATGGISPTFITANGQRFFISTILTANIPCAGIECLSDSAEATNPITVARSERMQFRLVVVDLNGTKAPNSQLQHGAIPPDTVLFAIKADGTVVPLGRPEVDQTYFSAHVEYPEVRNEVLVQDGEYIRNERRLSDGMTLANAKIHAWGYYEDRNVGANPNYTPLYLNQHLLLNEPFSYSGFFHEIGLFCSNETGCTGANFSGSTDDDKGAVHADTLLVNIVRQFLYIYPNDATTLLDERPSNINTAVRGRDEGLLTGLPFDCEQDMGCTCIYTPTDRPSSRCKVNYSK